MKKIISCDWGTSALRLRLVDTNAIKILSEADSQQGILIAFDLWKKAGKPENERLFFYQSILNESIKRLGRQLDISLEDVPLIISGMASSNIGMTELPYKEMPFRVDGSDLEVKTMEANKNFKHAVFLISGAKTGNDVMRGEETQLIGCFNENEREEGLFIFPGTHSKHVLVKDGRAINVKTYMTGEFFELLAKKSILSGSLQESGDLANANNRKSFVKGIEDRASALLHNSFKVRTNQLFDKLSKEENYFYLSGLLIGTELNEIDSIKTPLTIVSNPQLTRLYRAALETIGTGNVKYEDESQAVVSGHCKIFSYKRE